MLGGDDAGIDEQRDSAILHRQVMAAVNRNDPTWLLWALGIPVDVRRADLIVTVQQILQAGRDKAGEVLVTSPIDHSRDHRTPPDVVGSLIFDFGPAIIMMMASADTRGMNLAANRL